MQTTAMKPYQTNVISAKIPLKNRAVNNITKSSNIVQIILYQISEMMAQRVKQKHDATSNCFCVKGLGLRILGTFPCFSDYIYNVTYLDRSLNFFWNYLILKYSSMVK